jgi:poly(A) polymerase
MKRLPEAAWRTREGLPALLDALGKDLGTVRFVGGAVRDTLLGLDVSDVDCATSLPPEESVRRIKAAGIKAVPTGIAHGTITAVLPSGPIEVTTLRRDVSTNGRHAVVAFTDDWHEDAARRDFTINALSAEPGNGAIHDYFGGMADLEQGRVRFIGMPLQRIAEDHLRILRFFRFHARFGKGAPDQAALAACIDRANDLMALSRERIADELLKLLKVADPGPTISLMFENGIFAPILPEIGPDGIARLIRLIARENLAAMTGDPLRRLGVLLPPSSAAATGIAQRLKLSRAATRRIEQAAATVEAPPRTLAYLYGVEIAEDIILRGPLPDAGLKAALHALADWEKPRLPVGGGELISRGLQPGPRVAATLQAIERRWIDEDFPAGERIEAIVADELLQALRAIR